MFISSVAVAFTIELRNLHDRALPQPSAFDPFFGFYQFGIPTTEVLASYSVNKPGVNGGAGIAFGSKWGGKFFAEARYHRIFASDSHTETTFR
jgi:hypothetical protein